MPWRGERDPYRIWLSEIILQQTRVAQGISYYLKFLEAYPSVADLANAKETEVLALWQGLGYYSRARNLHKAAQQVVTLGGQFPDNYQGLLALAGVGPYSAAAIASFAYGESVAVLDGNVYRVLSRYFNIDAPINKPIGQKLFRKLAQELVPSGKLRGYASAASAHNQAIMDFGATVCTPKKPLCEACPFADSCGALAAGTVATLPVKEGKIKRRDRYFDYADVRSTAGELLLRERGAGDIWQGLFDFAMLESTGRFAERPELEMHLDWLPLKQAKYSGPRPPVKHVLSHQDLFVQFWRYELTSEPKVLPKGYRWIKASKLDQVGVPRVIDRYLNDSTLLLDFDVLQ